RDLPQRAARAGAEVALTETPEAEGRFDLVLADVPCSGSGSWRRDPEGKWALTEERLRAILVTQAGILDCTAPLVAPGGALAYATCSILDRENHAQIAAFLDRRRDWQLESERRFLPTSGGDGFYSAILTRK
ncbi:MAG: RsmB/NOP family class I SAM-dependent RNA methyltransferase, partial [Tabrizicola sp.]|nr:RsmB/NOP family class I SAM-dependent RNA methyltransferase [Tabrizicola sp.]